MKLSKKIKSPRRKGRVLLLAILASTAVVACGDSSGAETEGSDSPTLTMWTLESEPNRVARTERNLAEFTKKTGIKVDLVTIEETNVGQAVLTNAASGTLPD